jgi:hypothetical protein
MQARIARTAAQFPSARSTPTRVNESSGEGAMTDVAIRSCLYDSLASLNGYIVGKNRPSTLMA